MNYIKQINGFERFSETNFLSTNAQLLWYKLMSLFNYSGWKEKIHITNMQLMTKTKINTEPTFIKARAELIKAGLIKYKKGCKGSPGVYQMTEEAFEYAEGENSKISNNVDNNITNRSEVPGGAPKKLLQNVRNIFKKYVRYPKAADEIILQELVDKYGSKLVINTIEHCKGLAHSAKYIATVINNMSDIISLRSNTYEKAFSSSENNNINTSLGTDVTYSIDDYERFSIFD